MDNRTYTITDMQAAFSQGIHASSTSNPAEWFINYIGGGQNNESGVSVTYNSSLTYAYVFAAVSMISSDIATLPLNVYAVDSNSDKEVDNANPAQWLLNDEPNDLMDALTMREIMQSHVLLWGNGYAAIQRNGSMAPEGLIPMMPDSTEALLDDNGRLFYRNYRNSERRISRQGGDYVDLQPRNVLHIKGLGWDGLAGHSVISLARNSWGLGMAAQKHGNKHFSKGAQPSIALTTESKLDQETADTLLQRWEERHAGDSRPALLTNGLKIEPFSMKNADSQWLESRAFQRVEVATWFKIPPHKLGDDSKIAYNSIESENRSYLNQTLKGWLKKWESECRRKLLTERARRNRSRVIVHDTQDLLTADIETQTDVLVKLRNAEIVNRNEVRRKLGWTSTGEGGEDFTNPNVDVREEPQASGRPPTAKERLDSRALAKQKDLLADRMVRMVEIEQKAVTKAADRDGNFIAWVDSFYDSFAGKLSEAIDPIISAYSTLPGVECEVTSTQVATAHVTASKQALLEVAGYSDTDSLTANVTEAVQSWPSRSTMATDSVMGESDDGI